MKWVSRVRPESPEYDLLNVPEALAKLLRSYALDAAFASDAEMVAACSVDDAKTFLAEAMHAKFEEEQTKDGL